MLEFPACDLAEDALLGGRVRLLQPRRGHRAGTDAVLLAAAADATAREAVADVGAGTGAVGLMIAARVPEVSLVAIERDARLAHLCGRNFALNGARGRVLAADVLAPVGERRRMGLAPGCADLVVTNPPFLEAGSSRRSPDAGRAAAHELPPGDLEAWLRACADLLKPKGRLALVHRADRLGDVLAALRRGFGGVRLRLVHPRADREAIRLVATATKGSRGPLAVLPPLLLHEEGGAFTPEAEALHRGEALLA